MLSILLAGAEQGAQHLAELVLRKQAPVRSYTVCILVCKGCVEFFHKCFLSLLTPLPSCLLEPLCTEFIYLFLNFIYLFIYLWCSFPFLFQSSSGVSFQKGPFLHPPCHEGGRVSWTGLLIFLQFLLCLDQLTLGTRKCTVQLGFCNS